MGSQSPEDSTSPSSRQLLLQSRRNAPSTVPKAALPAWATAAMRDDGRAQPWKNHAGAETDDADYAQSEDNVPCYDDRVKVCYSENSIAA
jgi:hypothetical protein